FVGLGIAFWVSEDARVKRGQRISLLVVHTLLAITVAVYGSWHFAGAVLAGGSAEGRVVLPLWASIVWAIAQASPLGIGLFLRYDTTELAKSTGAYLAFSGFAIAVVHLFESERRARVALARADERIDIARDLHDVLGHKLAGLQIQLDVARRKADESTRGP